MHATEPFKFAYSCAHSVHERMCLVMTNERLNPGILNKYIFLQSRWQPFQVTWYIDQKSRKEKLHWNDYVSMCMHSKTPLGTCLSIFTQAQLNRNQDFVVPVLDSSRASFARSAG